MAKQGMRRERYGDIHGVRKPNGKSDKNEMTPVPEIQGKAKTTKEKASPIRWLTYNIKKNIHFTIVKSYVLFSILLIIPRYNLPRRCSICIMKNSVSSSEI